MRNKKNIYSSITFQCFASIALFNYMKHSLIKVSTLVYLFKFYFLVFSLWPLTHCQIFDMGLWPNNMEMPGLYLYCPGLESTSQIITRSWELCKYIYGKYCVSNTILFISLLPEQEGSCHLSAESSGDSEGLLIPPNMKNLAFWFCDKNQMSFFFMCGGMWNPAW